MRTKIIGTKTLAVSFTIECEDVHATIWSRGRVVGILNAPSYKRIAIFKNGNELQVLVDGDAIWVKAKYLD